jgi:hypothetical protein
VTFMVQSNQPGHEVQSTESFSIARLVETQPMPTVMMVT